MRRFHRLFTVFAALIIGACGNAPEPGFGEFQALETPVHDNATGPRISTRAGTSMLSWMERHEDGHQLLVAVLEQGAFGPPQTVTTDARMFVNWADLPSVTRVDANHWFAHWLSYSADESYSYDVVVSQSIDAGATWSEPHVAHTDGTHTEHGFVSIYEHDDGTGLLWLDGRNTPDAPMTLRGAVVAANGSLSDEQEVDSNVCDCCQTAVAISSRGPLAVYRDRTRNEIRDIYITRHDGTQWLPGTRLYADDWNIAGCPVNGPAIIADGDFVAVAWFSGADDQPTVRVVLSNDGGESFAAPVEIASGRVLGHVGLAFLDDDHVAVSWVGRTTEGPNPILVRAVGKDGIAMQTTKVGETLQLRVVPQIVVSDSSLVVVWTDDLNDKRIMKAASADWRGP